MYSPRQADSDCADCQSRGICGMPESYESDFVSWQSGPTSAAASLPTLSPGRAVRHPPPHPCQQGLSGSQSRGLRLCWGARARNKPKAIATRLGAGGCPLATRTWRPGYQIVSRPARGMKLGNPLLSRNPSPRLMLPPDGNSSAGPRRHDRQATLPSAPLSFVGPTFLMSWPPMPW